MFDTLETAAVDILRDFAATPETVYRAWTTPQHFAAWWGGEAVTVPLESVSMDVREGGTWTAQMVLPDGSTMDWHGEFVELTEFSRIVMTLADRPGDEREVVTVDLVPTSSGCQMRARQHGGHMDEAGYRQITAGYQTFFDAMQKIVES